MIGLLRRRRRLIDVALRAAFVVVLVFIALFRPTPAGDAHAYWMVDVGNPYTRPIATQDAFTYPPPAALFFGGLRAVTVTFEAFEALWTLLIGFVLLWLTGPWALAFLVIPVVYSDLYLGNLHVLLGAAIVASVRWPAAWAIPLLTKPTCGIGLLWFVARGEWRRLAVALVTTTGVALVSWLIAPELWPKWIAYVLDTGVAPNVGSASWVPLPLLIRLPAAGALVVWGARTSRPWTLPTAAMLALPVLWLVGLAMLTATFALSPWGPLRSWSSRWAIAGSAQL